MNTALITGISGQDGSYLAELLLQKGYQVHGIVRRTSAGHHYPNISHIQKFLHLHQGDLNDSSSLSSLVSQIRPTEIYNLAAQSHVHTSFAVPEYTAETNAVGVMRLLEAARGLHQQGHKVKVYQAGTSEMFGLVQATPQTESTPFYPRSPYGVSKLFAHWTGVNYRESYRMFVCNGILFNHESLRRGLEFVTRKITYQTARVVAGLQSHVELGNFEAQRDWGHARDFVQGMWMMLQQSQPDDYVLATGRTHSVRHFCNRVAEYHNIKLEWQGEGANTKAINTATGRPLYVSQAQYWRPAEVDLLMGDATKARSVLGWQPSTSLEQLVEEMCYSDWQLVTKQEKHK